MPLFQQSVIKKHIEAFDAKHIEERWSVFKSIFHTAEKQTNIRNSKEEQYQEGFLRDLFVNVLGYTINPEPNFNLLTEQKNVNNSKKADGAILVDGKALAVIELKGTETTDLNKIETQAFGYKNNQPGCNYVITSNFEKLRFYIDNTTQQEEFNLFTLTKAQFELLYACLAWESIKSNVPTQLLNESVSKENTITKSLYKDYSEFKRALFANLVELNPQFDKLVLFKKTQKLLDRFLFIFFAEDRGLLPTNLIFRINKEWENIISQRIQVSLYDRYKMYFNDLNVGAKVTLPAFGKKTGEAITAEFDIFAYNGGLFVPDEILDNIKIDDALLHSYTQKMSHYNFESDVDVNILGHIFENSLNEIDEIKSEIEGNVLEKTKTRRKKDGVFYTPKYITKYIVDNTVGKLCSEKKEELKLNDEDYVADFEMLPSSGLSQRKMSKTKKKALLDKLNEYRSWLLDLTICDPACGSGAFLNQALEFLIAEHRYVDELQAKLLGDSFVLSDIENSILERNIYGVDLNDESVEIAKLSLWLRTAQKGRKLNSLNNNIKCGNSLIDDPAVAGEKAFSWEKEFPEVFAEKVAPDGTLVKSGGFDVVIGNPPYVSKTFSTLEKDYLNSTFLTAQYQLDLYISFMELGTRIINESGTLSYIVPNSWMKNLMFDRCREYLLEKVSFSIIIPNLENVFTDASVDTMIFIANSFNGIYTDIEIGKFEKTNYKPKHNVDQKRFLKNTKFTFDVEISKESESIFKKIDKGSVKLHTISDITRGINPYDSYRGQDPEIIKNQLYHSTYSKDKTFVPEIRGKHVNRYSLAWDGQSYVSYGNWLAAPREPKYFTGDRIICRQVLGTNLNCTYLNEDFIIDQSVFIAKFDEVQSKKHNPQFVLVQLTSKLISFYFKYKANEFDALFPKIKIGEFRELPVKSLKISDQLPYVEKGKFMISINLNLNKIAQKLLQFFTTKYHLEKLPGKLEKWYELEFVDFIKELNKAIKAAKGTPLTKKDEFEWMDLFEENKKKALELKAQIDQTDKEIDQMVYQLYGLTEEEIKIVENS